MKHIKILLSILLVGTFLVGCDKLGLTVSEEEKYSALSSLMSNPNPTTSSDTEKLSGKFTFSARTITEIEEWELDGEKYNIVVAIISRNVDDYLLISVNDIEDYDFAEGSYITVTGSLEGSIYWTADNEQIEALHVSASKVEALSESDVEMKEEATFELANDYKQGTLTFTEANGTSVLNNPGAYLYFEFENTNSKDDYPLFDGLVFYQGDVMLKRTIMPGGSELKPDAIKAEINNNTPSGKTGSYYVTLEAKYSDEKMNDTEPIEIIKYDDDFNVVQIMVLDLQ